MTALFILIIFNYSLVLLYGLLLSALISGGWKSKREKRLIFLLCPAFLAIQGLCAVLWNVETTKYLYPLIIHLPIFLILTLVLKRKPALSLISICMAYLCCQFPRWIKLAAAGISDSALVGETCYTLCIVPIFYLLRRYFVPAAHSALTFSRRILYLFGSIPVIYYLFDYATTVYSDILYQELHALNEFLPSIFLAFYTVVLISYHIQVQKRLEANLQNSVLETQKRLFGAKLENLRNIETQAAIYQHDMRHHLVLIEGYLSNGNYQQAEEYIQSVRNSVDSIVPKRFCENETVNLLCSAFAKQAAEAEVQLKISVQLPSQLPISDTELCSLLSNGLENALHAVSKLEKDARWVSFFCSLRRKKLLLEIRNPYTGTILLRDELPASDQPGHGFGCQSIQAIVQQHQGICSFEPNDGLFTLRVMLPMENHIH